MKLETRNEKEYALTLTQGEADALATILSLSDDIWLDERPGAVEEIEAVSQELYIALENAGAVSREDETGSRK